MNKAKLEKIISSLSDVTITVAGDFCLDKYLYIDPSIEELSRESGLPIRHVYKQEVFAGSAGTIAKNLKAIGVGKVLCVGTMGNDGDGYELKRCLDNIGCDTSLLMVDDEVMTNVFAKPILKTENFHSELNRIDIRRRWTTPRYIQEQMMANISEAAAVSDALILMDQFDQPNTGVITDDVREHIITLAGRRPDLIVYADSRECPDKFSNMIVKCNNLEIVRAIDSAKDPENINDVIECGKKIFDKTGRPVYVTLGADGIMVFDASGANHVNTIRVDGPCDICGAGDAATSGIVPSLCVGANGREAALVGNIVASITIQQIGTTGQASPVQILERYELFNAVTIH